MSTLAETSAPTTRVTTPVQGEKKAKQGNNNTDLAETVVEEVVGNQEVLSKLSTARKIVLMAMFSTAEFLDAFNNSALFPAIPIISQELSFAPSETVWIVSAYQLTFAAFLLVSGRISDVYSPKPAFVSGALILGLTHLGGGFVRQKIALLVLRAIGGIGAALTIPSALSMIVGLYPSPKAQSIAIGIFGGLAAIGNVLGLIIGALLVQYTSWPWIFYFTAIMACLIGGVCLLLIPNSLNRASKRDFDIIGISTLAAAVTLFIFAVTSGSIKGWGTAYVLTPLIISLILVAAFFVWEARVEEEDAVIPPSLWRYPNVPVLAAVALSPFLWWVGVFIQHTAWFERFLGWSASKTAVHFLVIGVPAFIFTPFITQFPQWIGHKNALLLGGVLAITSSAILPFADSADVYWRFTFPGFLLGTTGSMILYTIGNIAIFASTPPQAAGTVGAIFNSALQLGSAVGVAVISSIQTSIDGDDEAVAGVPLPTTRAEFKHAFRGRAAGYWFVFAIMAAETIAVLVFFRSSAIQERNQDTKDDLEDEKPSRSTSSPSP